MRARSVSGLVVAVTGAGNGIGLATASRLVAAGAQVSLGDVDGRAARAAAESLGSGAIGLDLDVADAVSFAAFLDATERTLGPVDVLVNNAGVMWVGPYDAEPDKVQARQVAVNLLGAMRGVRLAAPRMVARGGGQVVTIASAASRVSPPGEATYAATKHGIHGYLKGVRAELRGTGVGISVVLPAVVDTALAVGTRAGGTRLLSVDDVADAVVRTIERPRFEVYVPGRLRVLDALVGLLPQPVRDAFLRRLVPDQLAALAADEAARDARHGYESTHFGRR